VCPRLFYLENDDYIDDEPQEEGADLQITPEQEPPPRVVAIIPTVSLHALAGVRTPNAMLLPVSINGHCLVALVDSGCTTNFMSVGLMSRLQLPSTPHPTIKVQVANGDNIPCQGMVWSVDLQVGTEQFSIDCIGLTLGTFDVILGFEFLRLLGPILWDCDCLSMSFTKGGCRIIWSGQGAPGAVPPQPAACVVSNTPTQPLLDDLLWQFEPVFIEPQGLPPARPYDHHIHLLPGAAPVAVRPYRYP
jgi:hypothetical protein